MRKIARAAVVAVGIGAVGMTAAPASAAQAALIGLDSGGSNGYTVVSQCSAVAGATTSLNSITYVVDATAVASSTKTAAAVGTSVRCQVVGSNGVVYGGASGGLPGPTAVAAGTATVPTNITAFVRVCGSAVFSDGGSASSC
jgi:hypothetical protein